MSYEPVCQGDKTDPRMLRDSRCGWDWLLTGLPRMTSRWKGEHNMNRIVNVAMAAILVVIAVVVISLEQPRQVSPEANLPEQFKATEGHTFFTGTVHCKNS